MAPENNAAVLEQARDLRGQLAELDSGAKSGIVFMEPPDQGRVPTTIYSLINGEPITLPRYMAEGVIGKRNPDGPGYMFTAHKENAPEYKLGTVKCFLHPESTYRTSGILDAAGVQAFSCNSGNHPSDYAMEEVAKGKHRKQWAAVQAYLDRQERAEERAERKEQTDAMLALAGRPANAKAEGTNAEEVR